MVCSGATVDNDFLLQALQRTLTHRHNSLHRYSAAGRIISKWNHTLIEADKSGPSKSRPLFNLLYSYVYLAELKHQVFPWIFFRSKVLFNLLEIYVEAEAHQRGFEMNMSKISQYWSSILSRCSIIPLTPRCTGSLWILNHGSRYALEIMKLVGPIVMLLQDLILCFAHS